MSVGSDLSAEGHDTVRSFVPKRSAGVAAGTFVWLGSFARSRSLPKARSIKRTDINTFAGCVRSAGVAAGTFVSLGSFAR